MADTMQGGFLRDQDGVLVAVLESDAVLPLTRRGGFFFDADGALVLSVPSLI